MKVLITGATGFLGRNLAEYFSGRYELLLPSHRELDLLDEAAVREYLTGRRVSAVIHAAAVSVTRNQNSDSGSTEKNLQMFYNLANCDKLFNQMIFCGSGAVYDKRRDLVMVKEQDFGQSIPVDPYGLYKYECSKHIEQAENIIDLRLFGVFGKYEDYATRFISHAICRAILGLPINIIQDVKFEYLDVGDFAKIVEYFIGNSAHHKGYNVGTGVPIKLSELAEKIKTISKKDIEINIKKPGLNKEYTCDVSRLGSELTGFEFKALDTSLKELYNWYQGNRSQIDKYKLEF